MPELAVGGDHTGEIVNLDNIQFPSTQVPSADPNSLDDYEEGTWTPGLADSSLDGSGEGQVYTTQIGRYVKIGRMLWLYAEILTSSIGTLTTTETVSIVGVPFVTSAASSAQYVHFVGFASGLSITAGMNVSALTGSNVSRISLYLWDSAAGTTALLVSEWSADGRAILSGFYEV